MKILKQRDVKTPSRGTKRSAGIDFYVPNDAKVTRIRPNESVVIPSGIIANVPDGHALIAFNKSSVAKEGVIVGACVVDGDYQGEILINLINTGWRDARIMPGQKIIQLVLVPVVYESVEEVHDVSSLFDGEVTDRGQGGFGSTGNR